MPNNWHRNVPKDKSLLNNWHRNVPKERSLSKSKTVCFELLHIWNFEGHFQGLFLVKQVPSSLSSFQSKLLSMMPPLKRHAIPFNKFRILMLVYITGLSKEKGSRVREKQNTTFGPGFYP